MFGVNGKKDPKEKSRRTTKKENAPHIPIKLGKMIPWIVLIILIILLGWYYLYKNYYNNYNYIKKDIDQYLVYTKRTTTNNQNLKNEIPEINIDSQDANLVNETIETYASSFLKNKDNVMVYDSQLNGQVLSVLLKMLDYSGGYSFPDVSFHTYNFNLKDQTLMSDEEVLSLFNITEDTVRKKIQEQFEFFYNDEVEKNYIVPQECDYECFLTWRNIEDYMDSVYYYIENGKLYAYRPFTIYSVYGEEEYFTDESYKIYIIA